MTRPPRPGLLLDKSAAVLLVDARAYQANVFRGLLHDLSRDIAASVHGDAISERRVSELEDACAAEAERRTLDMLAGLGPKRPSTPP